MIMIPSLKLLASANGRHEKWYFSQPGDRSSFFNQLIAALVKSVKSP
jgi:hypothetical protein